MVGPPRTSFPFPIRQANVGSDDIGHRRQTGIQPFEKTNPDRPNTLTLPIFPSRMEARLIRSRLIRKISDIAGLQDIVGQQSPNDLLGPDASPNASASERRLFKATNGS